MKKVRGAVVLVILVCLAAMSPVTVYAEEPTTYIVSTADAFLNAVDEINAAEGGAYEIVLDDNIDFTGGVAGKSGDFLKLKNNTVTIKGSGHEIILYNTSLFVNGNAVLNLGAEGYDGSLSIKSGDNTRTIIGLNGNAVLNMYDNVSIGGNSFAGGQAGGQAGGIQIEGSSKFNMYGGTIHDCINWASVSGGVFIDGNGVFTMNDGKIIDCSGYQGGGVCVTDSGTFVMNDGEIRDCTDNWYGGGGVNVWGNNAGFTMNGGKITGCKATYDRYGLGGGVFAYTNGAVLLNGGEVVNNHAANAGDDVFYYGSGGMLKIGYAPNGMTLTGCGHGIDGWYVDGVLEGEDTLRWNETETETVGKPVYVKKYDIPEGGSVTTAQLALKAAHAVYNYTIEYYIDGKLDETLTEHGTAAAGSLKDEEIPDKCPEGYKFDKRENGEVTEPDADGKGVAGSFTVKIYYIEDKTPTEPTVPPTHYYIVKWNNYDNTNLETDYCTFYQLPTYDGPVPVKPEDENYTYEFIGWDKEIVRVTGDEVYTAQFRAIEKQQPEPVEPDEPENPGENGDKPLLDNPYLDEKENGSEDTNIPKTGDKTEDALILNLMLLSLAALAGAGIHLKKTYRK